MSVQSWSVVATIVGPTLLFITWLASRKTNQLTSQTAILSQTVDSQRDAVETMKSLLHPMEERIDALTIEIALLRVHISNLEDQITSLGHTPKPPPPMPFERFK